MNDADFLEPIMAAPFEDGPRLIWADWLEERGDPRAEFIRAQCAAARLPNWDAGRAALEERADALWQEHGFSWQAGLPEIAGASWGKFERGMPHHLVAKDYEALVNATTFVQPPSPCLYLCIVGTRVAARRCDWLAWASGLDLAMSGIDVAEGLLEQCAAGHLQKLSIIQPWLRGSARRNYWDILTEAIGTLQIRDLSVSARLGVPNQEGEWLIDVERLARYPGLRRLHLSDGACQSLAKVAGASGFAALEQLCLSGDLSGESLRTIGGGRLKGLLSLRVVAGELASCEIDLSTTAAYRLTLEDLQMRHATVGDQGLAWLAQSGLQRLRSLSLVDCELGPAGVQALAASPLLAQLEWLDLSGNRLGEAGARALIQSPHLTRLRRLTLRATRIDYATSLELASRLPKGCDFVCSE